MEQTETPMMTERKPQVEDVVLAHNQIKSTVAVQLARPTVQMVAKKTWTLMAGSLDNNL